MSSVERFLFSSTLNSPFFSLLLPSSLGPVPGFSFSLPDGGGLFHPFFIEGSALSYNSISSKSRCFFLFFRGVRRCPVCWGEEIFFQARSVFFRPLRCRFRFPELGKFLFLRNFSLLPLRCCFSSPFLRTTPRLPPSKNGLTLDFRPFVPEFDHLIFTQKPPPPSSQELS